jgi:HD-GYP domain-containing protein (c-di-GMP phosphodiesterase class II)
MLVSNHENIDIELADDFSTDFNQGYEHCESLLLQLEGSPADEELTRDLFRSIHTIKGNMGFIGLVDLVPLLQTVEDILDLLRSGLFYYDDLLSDLILLSLDKTKLLVDENLYGAECDINHEKFDSICTAIGNIATVERSERKIAMQQALQQLDPNIQLSRPTQSPPQQTETDNFIEFLKEQDIEISDDIYFISQLTPAIEERSSFWAGHSFRIARLSLLINEAGGTPVEPAQLVMATLMHDISMAFLPISLLHKELPYGASDKKAMQTHVRLSHELLSKMRLWEEAEEIVLQHHERCDGSGYPKGLLTDEICPGAKILAIADTFDACCYARAYKTEQKRPLVRAILEINRNSGGEFDQHWVDVFNQVVKTHFVSQ